MRLHILIGGKRYSEAAAFVRDPRTLPEVIPRQAAEGQAKMADTLAAGVALDKAAAAMQGNFRFNAGLVPHAVPAFAELGAVNLVFEVLEAYYFGGRVNSGNVPPPGLMDARDTAVLFAPPVLAFRGDPRHASLLERTGLEDYWRKSRSRPDFRRG
jgi:hypothetical protein